MAMGEARTGLLWLLYWSVDAERGTPPEDDELDDAVPDDALLARVCWLWYCPCCCPCCCCGWDENGEPMFSLDEGGDEPDMVD